MSYKAIPAIDKRSINERFKALWKALLGSAGGAASPTSYKLYSALISQVGTGALNVILLNGNDSNFLGDIAWERVDVGTYHGTLANTFLDRKVVFNGGSLSSTYQIIGLEAGGEGRIYGGRMNDDVFILSIIDNTTNYNGIELSVAAGNTLPILVEIRIYP